MRKVVSGTRVSIFDKNNNMIMYIDYSFDECIWYFKESKEITITKDEELYELLKTLFSQEYEFNNNSLLKSYKNDNELIWYSDCYYNPDDEWSINNVSYLKIEFNNDCFKLRCIKPLDDVIDRKNKYHIIGFSPLGNGKYAKNKKTGLTLQDEFVINVYHKLLEKGKVRGLQKIQV